MTAKAHHAALIMQIRPGYTLHYVTVASMAFAGLIGQVNGKLPWRTASLQLAVACHESEVSCARAIPVCLPRMKPFSIYKRKDTSI